MLKYIIPLIAILVLFSCTPGVKRVLPVYKGTESYNGVKVGHHPYPEVRKFYVWSKKCTLTYCNYYTNVKIRVHNPLNTSFHTRVYCKYYVGDYHHSTIKSKWFHLKPRTSVDMDTFTNIIDVLFLQEEDKIKAECDLDLDEEL
jgi:hypothetical protein